MMFANILLISQCIFPVVTVCGPHLEIHIAQCENNKQKYVQVIVDAEFKLVDGCPSLIKEKITHVKDLSFCG